MEQEILTLARGAAERAVQFRREIHRHPELAYTEFRTAALVARRLHDLGFELKLGPAAMKAEARLGLPAESELEAAYRRAEAEGADPEFLPAFRGGFPAVVAELRGEHPGPVVALRVDMDALPIIEAESPEHLPARAGFASAHPGIMHACGHDGHTAIGLAVAEVLAGLKARPAGASGVAGTYRLIFQPGEEGGKGAVPMVEAGAVDGVQYFLACHLGLEAPSGTIYPMVGDFLASTKLDVTLRGASAHAAGRPEDGRNALLGAAQAAQGLYAISRHSEGASRVNVGVLRAGSGRNVIPDHAFLQLEVRGSNDAVEAYMLRRTRAVLEGAALAHELDLEIAYAGRTATAVADAALGAFVGAAAAGVPGVRVAAEALSCGGSEDATFMMRRVQEQGGLATYIGIGSDLPSGHHTPQFDIQESDLFGGIATLALAMTRLGAGAGEPLSPLGTNR
ncbi:MAG TPA: amidohydrolase [Symbiobacteriaceae bacterium]|jgi:aminobenzoyl-glutamate utilization protein A